MFVNYIYIHFFIFYDFTHINFQKWKCWVIKYIYLKVTKGRVYWNMGILCTSKFSESLKSF